MAVTRFACLCIGLWAFSVPADTADLDRVLAALAQRQHSHATFTERQYLALLERPLESSGEVFYDAPDRFEKRTLAPRRESLLLDHGTLTMQRGRRRHMLDLNQYPQLLPFVESIRATLAGDRGALERLFELEFEGRLERWTLRLTPRDKPFSRVVSEIRIAGEAAALRTIEIRQTDGDRSMMTLDENVAP